VKIQERQNNVGNRFCRQIQKDFGGHESWGDINA